MFRPYSLTSIAAWTVGSLAGNYAYYGTKQRLVAPKLAKASCPTTVLAVIDKLKAIEQEAKSLVNGLNAVLEIQGQVNVTPIIRVFAYEDWLLSTKLEIRAEIATAYGSSIAKGYLWPSTQGVWLAVRKRRRAWVE